MLMVARRFRTAAAGRSTYNDDNAAAACVTYRCRRSFATVLDIAAPVLLLPGYMRCPVNFCAHACLSIH
eukprot:SAG31_NODE_3454_length_4253_cov_2.613866_5_plen_69_part_00